MNVNGTAHHVYGYRQPVLLHPSNVTGQDVTDLSILSDCRSLTLESVRRMLTSCRIAAVRRSLIDQSGRIVGVATLANLDLLSGHAGIIADVFIGIKDADERLRVHNALLDCLLKEADETKKRRVAILDDSRDDSAKAMYLAAGFVEDGLLLSRTLPQLVERVAPREE